ncbi:MAG: hypothetical protein ACRD82_07660 [Blastocatellia bacterium]
MIPLLHWRKKIASEQAKAQVEIQSNRAKLVAESSNMRAEGELERERLTHLEEKITLGNEYVTKLEQFAKMKTRERQALANISDPELRAQIAAAFGITESQSSVPPSSTKPVAVWQGNKRIDDLGN